MHSNAALKCKRAKTTLNKQLEKRSQMLTPIERQKYMTLRLEWYSRLREDTKNPMTTAEFEKSLRILVTRSIRITFRAVADVHTFRSMPKRYMFFYTYRDPIMEELDNIPSLKELVLGDVNFQFDPVFIELMQELSQVHLKMLSHLEKDSEIEFNSIWDMHEFFLDFIVNHRDERQPLSDGMRM